MTAPRFAVNYTPGQGWFHHWLDFDPDAVRADLDQVAALGLDHVRVFPPWPLFQPNRTLIRPRAVEQLVPLADATAERGLDVAVDGLQGHLSSYDFRPAWTVAWHRRNLFTDPEVVEAQARYLRTLAQALADRPNFLGKTLGNEIDQFSGDPHPDPDRITPRGPPHGWSGCSRHASRAHRAAAICTRATTPRGIATATRSPRRTRHGTDARPRSTRGSWAAPRSATATDRRRGRSTPRT